MIRLSIRRWLSKLTAALVIAGLMASPAVAGRKVTVNVAPKRKVTVNVAPKRKVTVNVAPKRKVTVNVAPKRKVTVNVAPKRKVTVNVPSTPQDTPIQIDPSPVDLLPNPGIPIPPMPWPPLPIPPWWCPDFPILPCPPWYHFPILPCPPVPTPLPPCVGSYAIPAACPAPVLGAPEAGVDLALVDVRVVDDGDAQQSLGPRYRVWVRNNSALDITQDFNVMLLASRTKALTEEVLRAGVRIPAVTAGEIVPMDIRLPVEVLAMDKDVEGSPIPFSILFVLVDSHMEVEEAYEENNMQLLERLTIAEVVPAVLKLDRTEVEAGATLTLAGEGFGREPGFVLLEMGQFQLPLKVVHWHRLAVQVSLPPVMLQEKAEMRLLVIRNDRRAAEPVALTVTPMVAAAE